jgi:hypothetical protein
MRPPLIARDRDFLRMLGVDPAKLTAAEIKTAIELTRRISQCERVAGSCKRRPGGNRSVANAARCHPIKIGQHASDHRQPKKGGSPPASARVMPKRCRYKVAPIH